MEALLSSVKRKIRFSDSSGSSQEISPGKMDSQRNFTNSFLISSGKIYLIHITRHFIKVNCQYPKEGE